MENGRVRKSRESKEIGEGPRRVELGGSRRTEVPGEVRWGLIGVEGSKFIKKFSMN